MTTFAKSAPTSPTPSVALEELVVPRKVSVDEAAQAFKKAWLDIFQTLSAREVGDVRHALQDEAPLFVEAVPLKSAGAIWAKMQSLLSLNGDRKELQFRNILHMGFIAGTIGAVKEHASPSDRLKVGPNVAISLQMIIGYTNSLIDLVNRNLGQGVPLPFEASEALKVIGLLRGVEKNLDFSKAQDPALEGILGRLCQIDNSDTVRLQTVVAEANQAARRGSFRRFK